MKQIITRSCLLSLLIVSVNAIAEKGVADQATPGRSYYDSLLKQSIGDHSSKDEGKRTLTLGREYYYGLLDKSAERHWVVPISFFGNWTCKGFDCDGKCEASLANSVFGVDSVKLRDIFLLSRLCDNNKIGTADTQPETKDRPAGDNLNFGKYANDIATTLLAPMNIGLAAEQREFGINLGAAYRFSLFDSQDILGVVGFNVPVKLRTHVFDMNFSEGTLYIKGFNIPNTPITTSLTQFFQEFSSIEDFFARAVLAPKGLSWEKRQKKVGIGDISLFGLVDFGGKVDHADGLQAGMTVVCPTGNKACGKSLWEIELGNSGGFQLEWFANALFNTSWRCFNPCLKFVGQVNASHYAMRRTPQLRTFEGPRALMNEVDDLDLILSVEKISTGYLVDPYSELDTTVPAFADKAVRTRVKCGPKVMFGIGNYFYDLFNFNFRLGAFYDFTYKGSDKMVLACDAKDKFKTDPSRCTTSQAHRFGWNLTYKFESLVELNIGSEHVLAGKNVPKTHEAFASVILVF